MVNHQGCATLAPAEQIAAEFDISAEDIQRMTRHFVAQLSAYPSSTMLWLL